MIIICLHVSAWLLIDSVCNLMQLFLFKCKILAIRIIPFLFRAGNVTFWHNWIDKDEFTPWVILYQCNFSSSYQLDISLVQCALSWDIENSNPISTSSHVLFCLLHKHHRHLQTTWKATLLRNENLPFIHQPNKVARKAGDVQQLISDTNQRILYDKHLFLVIFPIVLQFSQIFIFHSLRDNVSKKNNGELFFYCKQLSPILH